MSGLESSQGAAGPVVSAAVKALAEADFSAIAQLFSDAGFSVALPASGMVQIKSRRADPSRTSVLLSVGVHGDETGPIEVLAHLLDALSRDAGALAVDLMVCVGNLDAIRAGKRFIDADLNRMFRPLRGALAGTAEAARADAMIAATAAFFNAAGPLRWHLDLHTAIRPSVYPTFAIVPELIADDARRKLIAWLGQAAIGAIVMNPQSAGTYSYYSAEHFGAAASTVELGRVGTLGQNDLRLFDDVSRALDGLLRGAAPQPARVASHIFKVAQEIIKLSDEFRMAFDRNTQNFTSLPEHAVIATDGDTVYTVKHGEELVVFPNPDVRVGLRAGLMVVRAAAD
ncbi:succinylglutamate desuccinylase [Janthinobacterium agaricidamnosum]|uniref:Succinylglutamate desuccinylase n=1 Tax=Janthinobacterium agaricidamnosum NBRC 102515 = DSM 9628 TaxID=1349767 RepID=W0UWY8_9BURK|nr:succinylglutamate desuccinylase [Janthinobacterium agaricidamnosum]CDG80974.1 succinylglutamate desuccinylase [Janthinobacterium agaricidamnosum NBRC 102515 = DSM 9628]